MIVMQMKVIYSRSNTSTSNEEIFIQYFLEILVNIVLIFSMIRSLHKYVLPVAKKDAETFGASRSSQRDFSLFKVCLLEGEISNLKNSNKSLPTLLRFIRIYILKL